MIVNPVNTTEAREISSFRKYLFKVPGILIRTPNFINYDKQVCNYLIIKSPLPGSNQRPTDYKSVALPAELRRLSYLVCRNPFPAINRGAKIE